MTIEKDKLNLELESVLERMLKQKNIELTKSDIRKVVSEILPDIDHVISQKVKNHFKEIGEFLIKNCK